MTPLVVRRFEPGDEAACFELHGRAFGASWSRDRWRWRFVNNLLQRADIVGAFAEGRCVACFAGVSLPFWLRGEVTSAINQSDVCTDPELRVGLGGSRLLVEVTEQFFAYCGQHASLIWGFPEPGLRRIVTRFARVEILRDLVFLVRDAEPACAAPRGVEVFPVTQWSVDVDRLWQDCRGNLEASVQRDHAYLTWRFVAHPGVDYELLEARDAVSGALRGIAVLREGGVGSIGPVAGRMAGARRRSRRRASAGSHCCQPHMQPRSNSPGRVVSSFAVVLSPLSAGSRFLCHGDSVAAGSALVGTRDRPQLASRRLVHHDGRHRLLLIVDERTQCIGRNRELRLGRVPGRVRRFAQSS